MSDGFAARAADAGFGIAHDPGSAIDRTGLDQRPDREIGRRGVAAGIRDQSRAGNSLAAELRQPVDRLRQQCRLRVRRRDTTAHSSQAFAAGTLRSDR